MKEQTEAAVEPDVLRDEVFVSSLISILTNVLGTAKDLYHRLRQKSATNNEAELPTYDQGVTAQDRRDSHLNIVESIGRHVRWSVDRRSKHDSDSEDDLVCSASVHIQSTYDRAYRKLGAPYARGDTLAKIQLQAHIIKLQQVLVSIHQDFMLSNYLSTSSSHSQLIHLVQTVRNTRAAAIQALDLLYQRMLVPPPIRPSPDVPPRRSRDSSPSTSDTSIQIPSRPIRPRPKPTPNPNPNFNKLFCRYALDLQHNTHLPLSYNFDIDGSRRCPHCHAYIVVRPKKAWEVVLETRGWHSRRKRFLVRNVFVVKCHRAGGGFACVLCAKCRDADTVCRSIAALIEHLWKEHAAEDLERDEDIVEC